MKASLQLKMGQQLTMTPQLQQAIRLLQLSTLDLQQEIQEALDSNPMLETEDHSQEEVQEQNNESREREQETDSTINEDTQELSEQWSDDKMPDELPLDSNWDDTFQTTASIAAPQGASGDDFDYDARHATTDDLQGHLEWQLNLTPMSETDLEIATMLIDGIDQDGYLHTTVDDILGSLDPELGVEDDEVKAVLKRLQQFDPPGVFARDLRECLILQLEQLPTDTPWITEAKYVVSEHINLLGSHDYTTLMRKAKLKEDGLRSVLGLIKALNPKPGSGISSEEPEYVVPDVLVRNIRDEWRVELNPDISPRLRVNADYASLIRRADNSADNSFLKDHLQEARWFIKSLQSRNDTLLKVAIKIVEYQLDFFEEGEEAMKPLVLHDIAEAVGMHESTISRVTTQKYMHTPRGIFELKYFFSSHVSTDTGGECSSTAIRAMIKKLIADENPRKPYSDNKLSALLGEKGIQVARRTVAKYREAMLIPPSNERKQLI